MSRRDRTPTLHRSVRGFVRDVNGVLGIEAMEIRYAFWSGLELHYGGKTMALGGVSETHLLTVPEQEAICSYFDLDQTLFGLDATD